MTAIDDLALVSGAGPEVLAATMRLAKRAHEEGLMEAMVMKKKATQDIRKMAAIMDAGKSGEFETALATFDLMGIAEEVLAEHGLKEARFASGNSLFSVMRPSPGFSDLLKSVSGFDSAMAELYRFHCTELAGRYVVNESMADATGSEIILGLLHASLSVPLRPIALAMMAHLCRSVPSLYTFASVWHSYESTGDIAAEIAEARHRLRVEDRAS